MLLSSNIKNRQPLVSLRMLIVPLSMIPVAGLIAAYLWGGYFAAVTILYMTMMAFLLDEAFDDLNQTDIGPAGSFLKNTYPLIMAVMHFVILAIAIVTLTRSDQTFGQWLCNLWAFGLYFGAISFSNAHELIHRRRKLHRLAGEFIFSSLGFGHHTSAHLLIHHKNVATAEDPNTAHQGETAYQFLKRAWVQSFVQSYALENARRLKFNKGQMDVLHPFVKYLSITAITATACFALAGAFGLISYLIICAFAQVQVLLVDYVQHYGLRREKSERFYEPVKECHSWDAPHWFSSAILMNAPRHSFHHAKPAADFTQIVVNPARAPQLPFNLMVMTVIALIPNRFFALIDPRLRDWNRQNQ